MYKYGINIKMCKLCKKCLTFSVERDIIISLGEQNIKELEVREMLTAICIIDSAIIGGGVAMLSGAIRGLW